VSRSKSQSCSSRKKSTLEKSSCDIADTMRDLIKCWSDRLTLENLRLSESYHKGELHILIRFRNRDSVEYIALFQGERRRGIGHKDGRFLFRRESSLDSDTLRIFSNGIGRHAESGVADSSREHGAMFVNNIQLMDMSEDCALSSIICFDSFERFNNIWPKSLYYSEFFGFMFCGSVQNPNKLGSVFPRRKIQPSSSDGCFPTVTLRQSVHKVVKGTTQIMNSISDNKGKIVRNGPCTLKPPNAVSRVKVIIGRNFVCLDLESVPFETQISDVLFGPFDFASEQLQVHADMVARYPWLATHIIAHSCLSSALVGSSPRRTLAERRTQIRQNAAC